MGLRLGFDIDGVLADFQTALGSACQDLIGIEAGLVSARDLPTVELKRAWRRIIRTPNWWTTLSAYEPDQIARLYDLTRRNRWEVFFLTKRPPTVGDTVQVQTQWWIESQGFYLPSVATVPSSRGEIAQALRLDLVCRLLSRILEQLRGCERPGRDGNQDWFAAVRQLDPAPRTGRVGCLRFPTRAIRQAESRRAGRRDLIAAAGPP